MSCMVDVACLSVDTDSWVSDNFEKKRVSFHHLEFWTVSISPLSGLHKLFFGTEQQGAENVLQLENENKLCNN